jgi:hypothetical protein
MRCHGEKPSRDQSPQHPTDHWGVSVGLGAIIDRDTRGQNLLEFGRLGELNEVLGPITLGDEWSTGLGRCLRACARTGHRKTRRPKNTRVPGGCLLATNKKTECPGVFSRGVTPVHKLHTDTHTRDSDETTSFATNTVHDSQKRVLSFPH